MKRLLRSSVKLALLGLVLLGSVSVGGLGGFLGRPLVEKHLADEVKEYTGVDVAAVRPEHSLHLNQNDISDLLVVGVGPNGLVIVNLPDGLETLVSSGSTHLVKVRIKEVSENKSARNCKG